MGGHTSCRGLVRPPWIHTGVSQQFYCRLICTSPSPAACESCSVSSIVVHRPQPVPQPSTNPAPNTMSPKHPYTHCFPSRRWLGAVKSVMILRVYLHRCTHTKQPNVFIAIVHETLQVTQEVSCSEWTNTLTCQWCALVTLKAGFLPMNDCLLIKTKKCKRRHELKSRQHPGGQQPLFLLLHTSTVLYQCWVYVGHWEKPLLKC